jgi:hypothetical protein
VLPDVAEDSFSGRSDPGLARRSPVADVVAVAVAEVDDVVVVVGSRRLIRPVVVRADEKNNNNTYHNNA